MPPPPVFNIAGSGLEGRDLAPSRPLWDDYKLWDLRFIKAHPSVFYSLWKASRPTDRPPQSALEALKKKWRHSPTTLNGSPVEVDATIMGESTFALYQGQIANASIFPDSRVENHAALFVA
jgi:hypothetical protein